MGVLTGMTSAQIGKLTTVQLKALTAADIAGMTTTQVAGLTAAEIATLTTAQLAGFSKAQMPYLTVVALAGLSTADMTALTSAQVSGLSTVQIAALATAQIAALSNASVTALSTTQVAAITAAELAALTPGQFSVLSAAQLGALTTTAIAGITTAQIAALSTTQLGALTAADITAIGPAKLASLSVANVALLTTAQIKGLTAAALGGLSNAQFAKLTAAQFGALSTATIAGLTTAEIALLTAAQLAGLTAADLTALSTTQTSSLSAANIAALSSAQLAGLTTAQIAALTSAQFGALTATQLGSLSTNDIKAFTSTQVAALTAAQIAGLTSAQISAMSSAQLGKLNITYNSMLAILQADAVGGMNATKFSALQTLASKFNVTGGIAVSAYVQAIADDVIDGNAANATWTGGGSKAVALGNLTANSSQTQVNELIGKWFLGTDLPTNSVIMSGASNFNVTYKAVSSPLYGSGGPKISDINQGYLGDCFLLAPLAEMAYMDPAAIQSMITVNGNNSYGVSFSIGGKTQYVTVDNQLANGGTLFNSGTNMWASIVEAAYVELQTSGEVTGDGFTYGNSFSSIASGGAPEMTLEEITGASSITDYSSTGSNFTQYVYSGGSLSMPGAQSIALLSQPKAIALAATQTALVADINAGDDLILSSYTDAYDTKGKQTLISDHAMAVYGFDSATNMFEIYNPWGTYSGQYWDTTFEISLATLMADGDTISVATNTVPVSGGTSTVTKSSATSSMSQAANLFIAASASLPDSLGAGTSAFGHNTPSSSPWSLAAVA